MTVLTARATADEAGARRQDVHSLLRDHAGVTAVLVASAWWLIEVTRAWAGRDAPSVTVGAILLALAVLLTRPHRVLPRNALLLAAAISVGAFVVPLASGSGWAGAPDAAIYVCGTWLAVVVAATVVARHDALVWFLILVAASAPIEFMSGWLGWWGGNDPTRPMLGTFYWHNPFAAFLIPGGLIGLAMWIWRDRLFRLLGLTCFTFASVGIVYSTSRAGLATFIGGFVLVGAAAAVSASRWKALRQVVLAVAVAAAATFFIAGPPFFSHRASPLAAEHTRAQTQNLTANAGQRIDFWRQALAVFRQHPVTGGGYKSLVAQSNGHVPNDMPVSPYAHNGYLQALGEGGLVLGVPFLLAVIAIAWLCLRVLALGILKRRLAGEQVAIAAALACVLLHSGVDFDWTYAADFAMAGLLAGLLLAQELQHRRRPEPPDPAQPPSKTRAARALTIACVIVGIGLLGVSAWVQRHGNHTVNLSVTSQSR